ncbi:MAG: UDP-N-acetylmuramoyl-L-alanine--D-glutamate ligase [Ruminococcaceae bacterium]|jgi:UDP-N-acetylmuramoylalanine--D-glutamate ligase|nr:UDP-N-acetylmuramoyl-L-alanine--D-glutamate ligase [Oscillospiraceae bacterium]
MFPEIIEYLKDKDLLLLGFGREGRSTLEYIRKYLPDKKLTLADKNPVSLDDKNVETVIGECYLDSINDYDLVIKSPGISLRDVEIEDRSKITCQVDLFLKFAPCRKIGITGSKGKTTTSTLTYMMLKEAGVDTVLIGNIGIPVFECIEKVNENTVAVIEMSSHQLEFCSASPEVAVFTNIFEEHLDHYKGGFTGYVNAKTNIARFQSEKDLFVYGEKSDIPLFVKLDGVKSEKMPVSDETFDLPFENEHLLGSHNRTDVCYAYAAARRFGVTRENAVAAANSFKGIEHRMEKVGEFGGIIFYNDCIATIPFAVMNAVHALKKVGTLIIGGKDRGLDYSEFVESLYNEGIDNIICMPDTGYSIGKRLEERQAKSNIIYAENMEKAVSLAFENTKKGKICLLSPAASSYNVYKNFEEKGRHYKSLIYGYSKKEG